MDDNEVQRAARVAVRELLDNPDYSRAWLQEACPPGVTATQDDLEAIDTAVQGILRGLADSINPD